MTPREALRALDVKRDRVLRHAEMKRLAREARAESGLSQEAVGALLGLSPQQVALRENVEAEKQFSAADLLVLFKTLPGLREACESAAPTRAAASLEAAVSALTLASAQLGAEAVEANADRVILPAEREALRRLLVRIKTGVATVEATLAEVSGTPVRSLR